MTKSDAIADLNSQLQQKISLMTSALADSSESASGDETKSEGKYDTRAIEAAYLAEAQAEQLALAEESLSLFLNFTPPPYSIDDQVGPGALVEVEQGGEICFYLLAPTAGGTITDYLGCELTIITPDSRLYQELIGKKLGDHLITPPLKIIGLE